MPKFISHVGRRSFGAWSMATLGILALAAGCDHVSSTEYHEYSHRGQTPDSLEPTATPAPTSSVAESNKTPADRVTTISSADPKTVQIGSATVPSTASTPAAGNDAANAKVVKPAADADAQSPQLVQIQPVAAPRPAPTIATAPNGVSNANPVPPNGATPPGPPRTPEVLVKEKSFRVEGPEGAIRVSYDDIDLLKVLNMEPVTPEALTLMPEWMKQLDGKRIVLRGFMIPAYSEELTGFAIARDLELCCFGREPKPYDVFTVRLREGHTTQYIEKRPFDVVGVFHIVPDPEEWISGMYYIDDARVIERKN